MGLFTGHDQAHGSYPKIFETSRGSGQKLWESHWSGGVRSSGQKVLKSHGLVRVGSRVGSDQQD